MVCSLKNLLDPELVPCIGFSKLAHGTAQHRRNRVGTGRGLQNHDITNHATHRTHTLNTQRLGHLAAIGLASMPNLEDCGSVSEQRRTCVGGRVGYNIEDRCYCRWLRYLYYTCTYMHMRAPAHVRACVFA